jgi:hypothetical protein
MIKLELTIEEVNTILRTLGKHPFDEVVTLIGKIREQGQPQAEALAKEQAAATPSPAAEAVANS